MAGALLEHLWQSTLFAVAAWLLTLALRHNEARVRYWVWFAASLKFVIPFSLLTFIGSQLPWGHPTTAVVVPPSVVTVVEQMTTPLGTPAIVLRAPLPSGFPLAQALLAIWAMGCVALLVRWLAQWLRINAAVKAATPIDIGASISVRSTTLMAEPGVVGIFRQVLLLPAGIAEHLTPAQMQAVLAHELCHVQRRDNLTAAIHMALEAVFWFHPLIWWIGARLVDERERACDEAVVRLGNEPQTYAEGILKVCQFYLESKLPCVAGVSGASLKRRIEVIMNNRITVSLSAAKKFLLATATAAAIAVPVGVGLTTAPPARAAQTDAAFDTVKITKPAGEGRVWFEFKDGKVTTERVTVRQIIAYAYGVDRTRVVGGPDWIDVPLYDIEAHTTAVKSGGGPGAYDPMFKTLLASRFGLLAHPETQSLSGFALRVAAGGTKLAPLPADAKGPLIKRRPEFMIGSAVDLQTLVKIFAQEIDRPVIDETGLQGRYDFAMNGSFTKETLPAMLRDQLGLTLEPTTAAFEVIVVDRVEQPALDAT